MWNVECRRSGLLGEVLRDHVRGEVASECREEAEKGKVVEGEGRGGVGGR